jgi:hypothetical protein
VEVAPRELARKFEIRKMSKVEAIIFTGITRESTKHKISTDELRYIV